MKTPLCRATPILLTLLFSGSFAIAQVPTSPPAPPTQSPLTQTPLTQTPPTGTPPTGSLPTGTSPTGTLPTEVLPTEVLPAQASPLASVRRPSPADVEVSGRVVYPVRAAVGVFTPAQRAEATSHRLLAAIHDPSLEPDDIKLAETEGQTEIVIGDEVLATVTDADSDLDAVGRTRPALAAAELAAMRAAMSTVRDDHSYRALSIGAAKAAAALLVLILLFVALGLLFPALYRAIERRRGTRIRTIRIQSLELLSEKRILEIVLQLTRFLRFALSLLLFYLFVPLVFSFFPATRRFGFQLVGYVFAPVASGWHGFVTYLPRLLVVVVVLFFTWQAVKLSRFLFKEVERGTIAWPGFYPEWAMPTSRIVDLILLAFALVVAFPYLPGSDSAAFKGVTIFLGVLVSLGSSSAVANIVAGVLLTYTRAFRVGDRVQIADTVGDVLEKTLLATHVRTIKNADITVPNALVLASHIVNFSQSSMERPLILHAKVNIGYDVRWQQVHELLIGAALRTGGVLAQPAPYILQTALSDFHVEYEVNAATISAHTMAGMYSELFRHILDAFNEAGVEIMSPHYQVMRTEEITTVPEGYLPVDEVKKSPRRPHLARPNTGV